jgi:malonate transporter MadL subunit
MTAYGVAILAFCYLAGQWIGEALGKLIGVDANVGGVGFAMVLLIMGSDYLQRTGKWDKPTESGVQFWNQMYIPIVVAMSATQNVKLAVSSGMIAILAGTIPVIICLAMIPLLAKWSKK